jgi:hypothetical protein
LLLPLALIGVILGLFITRKAFGGGDHVFVQNASYLELALPGAPAIRLPFTLPTVGDGRYTYFVDDVTSSGITTIEASVRLWFWVDENTGLVRFRQPSASNRSEDVFVHVEASSQSGPCHDNVLAIHHDCMELDQLDLMIEAQLRGALGEMMFTALDPQQQQSNLFAEIIGDIVDLLGPFSPNLQAIFVGDTGESLGSIFFVTN